MWQKYKEAAPQETIARISRAFDEIGVHMEPVFFEPVDNVVSVMLKEPQYGFETYGKGTSREWALASAYGEAAERLENRMLYSIPDADPGAPFCEWPDEERVSIREALQIPCIAGDFSEHFIAEGPSSPEDFLRELFGTDTLSNVPYLSVRSKEAVMLPDRIISLLCGSSGLSSGNTYDEALCQGLSEIAERYAKFSMFRANAAPVTVPRTYIAQAYPELNRIMEDIERKSGFSLYVRDARPVTGFPVLQVLLVDSARQRYAARFGCHPVFAVALERSITELLQGQGDMTDLSNMIDWPQERAIHSFGNLLDSLKADLGDLSDEFLSGVSDFEFTPWPSGEFTNRAGVRQLTDAFLRIAPDIYIRKTGFLGIPSVRIYIPGISPMPMRFSRDITAYNEARLLLHDPCLAAKELDEQTTALLYRALTSDDSFVGGRFDRRSLPVGCDELRGLLLLMQGRDREAMPAFEKAETDPGKCMYHYLRMTLEGKDEKVIRSVLEMFFGGAVCDFVRRVYADRTHALPVWLDPSGMFRAFVKLVSSEQAGKTKLTDLEKRVRERMLTADYGYFVD